MRDWTPKFVKDLFISNPYSILFSKRLKRGKSGNLTKNDLATYPPCANHGKNAENFFVSDLHADDFPQRYLYKEPLCEGFRFKVTLVPKL